MRDERDPGDPVMDRLVTELRVLPQVRATATSEVLARIAAQQAAGTPVQSDEADVIPLHRPRRVVPLSWVGLLAVAAALAGFMVRGVLPGDSGAAPANLPVGTATAPEAVQPTQDTAPVQFAADAASRVADEMAVPVQFVLDAPGAQSVRLVGDFNGWDGARATLVRQPSTGLWTITLPLTPGRHVYAFVVNDSTWTLDPRADTVKDADFGTEQSVVIVGRP